MRFFELFGPNEGFSPKWVNFPIKMQELNGIDDTVLYVCEVITLEAVPC